MLLSLIFIFYNFGWTNKHVSHNSKNYQKKRNYGLINSFIPNLFLFYTYFFSEEKNTSLCYSMNQKTSFTSQQDDC